MKNIKESVVKELQDLSQKEIAKNEIMRDFYNTKAEKTEDKEEKAKVLLKAKQLEQSLEFNREFYEFIK